MTNPVILASARNTALALTNCELEDCSHVDEVLQDFQDVYDAGVASVKQPTTVGLDYVVEKLADEFSEGFNCEVKFNCKAILQDLIASVTPKPIGLEDARTKIMQLGREVIEEIETGECFADGLQADCFTEITDILQAYGESVKPQWQQDFINKICAFRTTEKFDSIMECCAAEAFEFIKEEGLHNNEVDWKVTTKWMKYGCDLALKQALNQAIKPAPPASEGTGNA